MQVVFVSRSDSGLPNPFVQEQAENLTRNFGIPIRHFLIRKGGLGYLKAVIPLYSFIRKNKADIVHVHYGLSALVAVLTKFLFLQRYKIIITFHGSDINKSSERGLSLWASQFSAHNILVSTRMSRFFKKPNYSVIPCGIDVHIRLDGRERTRLENNWDRNDFVVLFSSSFNRPEKDPDFAFEVIGALRQKSPRNVRFLELKGYTRPELTLLMQAADALILCSTREGSPQVIKEAILNSLPVVANDVGDVKQICAGVDNCFVVPKQVAAYVHYLDLVSRHQARVQNRMPVIEKFDNDKISNQIYHIYNDVLLAEAS
ncbi:MAG: glycosyltransferase family 4 protein [Adhaeribacter sp.]